MNRKQFLAVIGAVIAAPFIKKEKRVWKTYTSATVTEASDGTFLIDVCGQDMAKGRAPRI
jgi:SOS-response transcriptional repressor LexA